MAPPDASSFHFSRLKDEDRRGDASAALGAASAEESLPTRPGSPEVDLYAANAANPPTKVP